MTRAKSSDFNRYPRKMRIERLRSHGVYPLLQNFNRYPRKMRIERCTFIMGEVRDPYFNRYPRKMRIESLPDHLRVPNRLEFQ